LAVPQSTFGPASPQQRSVLARHVPGGVAFNMPCVLALDAHLDLDALVTAIGQVINRHESLRTRFSSDGRQVVEPEGQPIDLAVVRDPDCGVDSFVQQTIRHPFDLEHRPPVKIRLVLDGDRQIVLAMVVHHAIFDGVSYAQVLNEIDRVYAALTRGGDAELGERAPTYIDYARSKNDQLGSMSDPSSLDAELMRYWISVLEGARFDFPMPFLRDDAATLGSTAGQMVSVIGPDVMSMVASEAASAGFSVFVAVHTATNLVVLTAFEDPDFEFDGVVGCRTNTLPIRLEFRDDDTVRAVLERDSDAVYGAMEHFGLMGPTLIDRIFAEGVPSNVRRVTVSYSAWSPDLVMPSLRARQLPASLGTCRSTLAMFIHEHRDDEGKLSLSLSIEYDLGVSAGEEAEVFLGALRAALRRVAKGLRETGLLLDGELADE
jgi:condensation domain-containing protein